MVTMLSIILSGAAVILEREHVTLEHLLVMPIRPVEIRLAKVLSMGGVEQRLATCLTRNKLRNEGRRSEPARVTRTLR